MKRKVLIIVCLLISLKAFNQYSFYKEALVIKKDGLELNGFVEKISESALSTEVKFKSDLQLDDGNIIPIEEIEKIVIVSDSIVFQNIIYEYKEDSIVVSEDRLAKKLVDGYAHLYKLQLPEDEQKIIFETENTYVYILFMAGQYYVLDQTEDLVDRKYKLKKNYQGVLFYLLRDYKDIQTKVWTLDFADKDMVAMVDKINKYYPQIDSKILIQKEKSRLVHGPVVGMALASEENSVFGNGYNIGYNFSLITPQLSEKYSVDFGISWCKIDFEGQEAYKYLRAPIGARYRFNNKKIAPYVKGGITFNYLNDNTVDTYFNAKLGISILKRLDVSTEIDFNPKNKLTPYSFLYFSMAYAFNNR